METTERYKLNKELAQMLKGGVIMDVTTPEQAKIAEAAGACAVMALERIPADIRAAGGVSRMSDPQMIKGIQNAVSIPVMAKCRIGHFAEAQILQAIEIDYIDESEVLSPADDVYHIDKRQFKVPFVCGAKDLGEALRRINEGASMIRTKGEPGTGDIVQAVRHMRKMNSQIAEIVSMRTDELYEAAEIDGCTPFKYLIRIVVPLSKPIIAVLVLYYGVARWNSYQDAILYLQKANYLQPLQIILREILIMNDIDETMMGNADALARQRGLKDLLQYSVIVIASVPVMIIYPFVQKYFVKGVMIGAVKG